MMFRCEAKSGPEPGLESGLVARLGLLPCLGPSLLPCLGPGLGDLVTGKGPSQVPEPV